MIEMSEYGKLNWPIEKDLCTNLQTMRVNMDLQITLTLSNLNKTIELRNNAN